MNFGVKTEHTGILTIKNKLKHKTKALIKLFYNEWLHYTSV